MVDCGRTWGTRCRLVSDAGTKTWTGAELGRFGRALEGDVELTAVLLLDYITDTSIYRALFLFAHIPARIISITAAGF